MTPETSPAETSNQPPQQPKRVHTLVWVTLIVVFGLDLVIDVFAPRSWTQPDQVTAAEAAQLTKEIEKLEKRVEALAAKLHAEAEAAPPTATPTPTGTPTKED